MWIVLAVVVILGLIVYIIVKGYTRANSHYRVVNRNGTSWHVGNYSDCINFAKTQNDFCKTFGIDDYFTIERWKL